MLKSMAVSLGNPEMRAVNVSAFLVSAKPRVTKLADGWILTTSGRDYVRNTYFSVSTGAVHTVAPKLRSYIAAISQADTKRFLEEAVACFEGHHYRAAVVLTWVGAVSMLQDYVMTHKLAEFNLEAGRRDSRWRNVTVKDGLSRMQEHDFLEVLHAISVIGKNVKQQLQNQCLNLRNACGHPNSLIIGEHTAAAHIEILVQNIFGKF